MSGQFDQLGITSRKLRRSSLDLVAQYNHPLADGIVADPDLFIAQTLTYLRNGDCWFGFFDLSYLWVGDRIINPMHGVIPVVRGGAGGAAVGPP